MNNHFLSLFDPDTLRKSLMYISLSVLLITVSLIIGLTDNFLTITMLLSGIAMFLYAVLRPWEKAGYFAVLGGVCLILLVFEFLSGIDILVKMKLKGDLTELILWIAGFIFFAGIITGIIGIFRFRKQ